MCFFSLLTIPQSFSSASSSLSVGSTKNSNSHKSKRLPCSKNTSEDCGNHHASCKIMSVNRLEFSDRATPPVQPWHLLVKSSSRCGHFGSRALVYRHPRRCRRCSGCGRCRCGRRGCRGGGSTTFMGHGGSRRRSSRTPSYSAGNIESFLWMHHDLFSECHACVSDGSAGLQDSTASKAVQPRLHSFWGFQRQILHDFTAIISHD